MLWRDGWMEWGMLHDVHRLATSLRVLSMHQTMLGKPRAPMPRNAQAGCPGMTVICAWWHHVSCMSDKSSFSLQNTHGEMQSTCIDVHASHRCIHVMLLAAGVKNAAVLTTST